MCKLCELQAEERDGLRPEPKQNIDIYVLVDDQPYQLPSQEAFQSYSQAVMAAMDKNGATAMVDEIVGPGKAVQFGITRHSAGLTNAIAGAVFFGCANGFSPETTADTIKEKVTPILVKAREMDDINLSKAMETLDFKVVG